MTLAKVQSELAALLMEDGRLDRFAKDPRGHLRRAGFAGKDLDLLAGLPIDGMRYFAQRRSIDRMGYLRGDVPRCVALLGQAGLAAYFRDHPYAFEEPTQEAARFARWAKAASRSGVVPAMAADIAQVEAAGARLMQKPHHKAVPGAHPRRAPGIKVLRLGHDPGHFLRDPPTPVPGRFVLALRRDADDVEPYPLDRPAVDLLRAADGRRPEVPLLDAVAREKGHSKAQLRSALRRLRGWGLIVPRP
jgi:hypothetical protein